MERHCSSARDVGGGIPRETAVYAASDQGAFETDALALIMSRLITGAVVHFNGGTKEPPTSSGIIPIPTMAGEVRCVRLYPRRPVQPPPHSICTKPLRSARPRPKLYEMGIFLP